MADVTAPRPGTEGEDYTQRLNRLGGARWKQVLDVQRPYRWNLRRLDLGACLDVGCGRGRNLMALDPGSVGVDHNPHSVADAVAHGCQAYTTEAFFADPQLARPGRYDSLLAAHLIEHLTPEQAREILGSYLPFVRPGGRCVFITPQELGYASDETHVTFTDGAASARLAQDLGLTVERSSSFPFPRVAGRFFRYNEFVVVARTPVG